MRCKAEVGRGAAEAGRERDSVDNRELEDDRRDWVFDWEMGWERVDVEEDGLA